MAPAGIAVVRSGMVTGVGLDAPATCAAIRAALDNFQESRFRDRDGEWLMASAVPLPEQCGGERRLLKMAARAIGECLYGLAPDECAATPLLLCLAEEGRPGRLVEDDLALLAALQRESGVTFDGRSGVIAAGHVATAVALRHAARLLQAPGVTQVLLAGCDSLLVGAALQDCERRERLMTSANSDGFIPGEAAAALLLRRAGVARTGQLVCRGVGFAVEQAHIDSEAPLRADGLVAAIRAALDEAGCGESVLQFKIIDASGGEYAFKEAALAFGRIDRTKRTEFDIWHPADCIGEVGTPIGLVMIGVLQAACEKGYARGEHVLLHLGNDDGRRAAMIFTWHPPEAGRGQ